MCDGDGRDVQPSKGELQVSRTIRDERGRFIKGKNFGPADPCWKGGRGKVYARIVAKRCGILTKCTICKSKRYLQIHHINGNQNNNDLSNLKVVCAKCHCEIHKGVRGRPKTGKTIPCDYCGKQVYRRKYRLRRKHQFCSYSCMGKWWKEYWQN